jgi:uncharacterized protein YjbJ (UPF0337 family)
MDKDRVKGAARNVVGKIKETLGKATGPKSTQAKGTKGQAAGKVQKARDRAKDIAKK